MSTDDSVAAERVVVGRIARAHGIHGDVFVLPLTDVPELRFADGRDLVAGDPVNRTLTVESTKDHSGKLVVRFVGIDSRNAAEALRNAVLEAVVGTAEATGDAEEFFDRQLQGLRAVDPLDVELGVVTDVVHLPGQDLLAVTLADGSERLVPFVKQIVPVVDLAAGTLTIDAPIGLLEDLDEGADAESDVDESDVEDDPAAEGLRG